MQNSSGYDRLTQRFRLSREWGWLLLGGIVSCVLGVLAWRMPIAASAGLAITLGIILLVGGVVHLVEAVRFRHYGGVAWKIFQSVISIVGGAVMLRFPVIGIMGISLTIIFYLFVSSASQFMMSTATRHLRGSGLLMFSSIVSFVLGIILIAQLPISALYIPGLFLGIDLFITGSSLVILSFRMRTIEKQHAARPEIPEERAA